MTTSNLPPLAARISLEDYVEYLKRNGRFSAVVQDSAQKAADILKNNDTVFYIGGALTGMSESVKDRYVQLSKIVASHPRKFAYAPHINGTDPVKHPDVTPDEVRDIDFMFSAVVPHAHINCLAPAAHGNAIEAAWAEMVGIPSIFLAPEDVTLSRLVRGMHNIHSTITYNDFEKDALPKVAKIVAAF